MFDTAQEAQTDDILSFLMKLQVFLTGTKTQLNMSPQTFDIY